MADKSEVFRQERKTINPTEVVNEPPVSQQFQNLEQVQAMQRELGHEVPEEPTMQIQGNLPPGFQEAMQKSKMQQQRHTREEPRHQPFDPRAERYAQFKDPNFEAVIHKLTAGKFDEVVLPSLGKFYHHNEAPSNGVLHIRAMTGAEEQILATPRYVKKGIAINKIFEQCISEQISSERLLAIDRTFLLIYLRGISYMPEYDVEVGCPSCPARFQTQINLNNLDVEECPEDFGPESLKGVLPTTGFTFQYRLCTGADEQAVADHRDQRIKEYGDNVADDTLIFKASLLLEEIEGVHGQHQIQTIIARLPIGDVAYLRNLISEPPFGVKTRIDIFCPSCTSEFEIDMPLEANFFFPRRKKEKI